MSKRKQGKTKQRQQRKVRRWMDRQKQDRVIDIEFVDAPRMTAWGGLALAERLACRTRLWSRCRQLGRNGIFYGIATMALNLTVGMRRIGMRGRSGRMSLSRLRRMLLAMPARTSRHARRTNVRLVSVSNRLRRQFEAAFARLAAC